jgi:hypothetical protein
MKRTIWKFPLVIDDRQVVNIPTYGEILSVQVQNGTPCIWVLVNPEEEPEPRHFEIFGTGNPFPVDVGSDRRFIGTFQENGFVWHLFERVINIMNANTIIN